MDFNSILDFIKENSWVLGSGGVVGKNSINIQSNNDVNLGDINNVRETKDRNRG